MQKRLQKEIMSLHGRILELGAMAEERVRMAIRAFQNRDLDLAREIIERDKEINEVEVEIEEECLKAIALYQPVAIDLRTVIAIIKINNDLERVGDEAVNISERITIISRYPASEIEEEIKKMADEARDMLKASIDSLVFKDVRLAYQIFKRDDRIDEMNMRNYEKIRDTLKSMPEMTELLINMLFISRHLERIADHATNIAEEVMYMVEGEIPRHGRMISSDTE